MALQDNDYISKKSKNKKLTLKDREREALRSLVIGKNEQWETVFDLFARKEISVNALLMGVDFYGIVWDFYNDHFDGIVFTDFLWTCRSMFLPIFTMFQSPPPAADIYHAVSTGYAGIEAARAAYLYDKPAILTEHGIYSREREEEIIRANWTKGIYKDLWIRHYYMLSRCIYSRAAGIFCIYKQAAEVQREIGCPPDKIEVIHNGIDFDKFAAIPPARNGEIVNIGHIARVAPIKDTRSLIIAFADAKSAMPGLRLYIMGNTAEDADYFNDCLGLIEMLGVNDIIFTGHVNLLNYVEMMDIIILTSISEGQPLSILEAMAAKKPCITTNVGDCYEMLNAGDFENAAGIVVPVMNTGRISAAIVQLAKSPDLRQRLGENGHAIAARLYRDNLFIDRYREIYNEMGQ